MRIDGSVAIVSGGASGLGLATAQALVARGASVAVLDLPSTAGAAVASELGPAARFTPADVTSEEAVGQAIEAATHAFGAPSIAVCCAGIGPPGRTVSRSGEPHGLDHFRHTLEVNLVGTFNVLRLAAAAMVARGPIDDDERGVLVTTASIAAFEGQIGQAAYAASKGGIVGLTLPVARDLAISRIRCTCIAPGTIDTPLLGSLGDEIRTQLAAAIPHPSRLGRPEEYAALVCHIVENALLNGEVIRLDGALRMAPR